MSLFGKRVLADVKDLEMKSSWTTQMDPKPNDSVLIESVWRECGPTDTLASGFWPPEL